MNFLQSAYPQSYLLQRRKWDVLNSLARNGVVLLRQPVIRRDAGFISVWSPTWSPDGKKLGYVGIDGIYFLDVNPVVGGDIYQHLCP